MIDEYHRYFSKNIDRFSARYMCKRNPSLWFWVLEQTSFLPDTAKPAQRCWHISSGVFEVPLCPVTKQHTAWFENRYLTYANRSAARKCPEALARAKDTYRQRTGFDGHWRTDPAVVKKSSENFQKTSALGLHRKYERSESWRSKVQATWDRKRYELGLDEFRDFQREVYKITKRVFRAHKVLIVDSIKRSRQFHLDHVFSIYDAWTIGVPAYIVASHVNLRISSASGNTSKGKRSDISVFELYDRYAELVGIEVNDLFESAPFR